MPGRTEGGPTVPVPVVAVIGEDPRVSTIAIAIAAPATATPPKIHSNFWCDTMAAGILPLLPEPAVNTFSIVITVSATAGPLLACTLILY